MDRRTFLMSSAIWAGSARLGMSSQGRVARTIAVGDDQIQVVLDCSAHGLREKRFDVKKKPFLGLRGKSWTVVIDGTTLSSEGNTAELVHQEDGVPTHRATFRGETRLFSWDLTYGLSGPGRITKFFNLHPKRKGILSHLSLWDAEDTSAPQIARTKIQDVAAFYRQDDIGLFASLDFPYSKIDPSAGITSISYPPHDVLAPGREYVSHSLTFGAVQLTGKQHYGFDEGETEAIDAYIQGHKKLRFERPMYVGASIVNRYTQLDGDIVFYTERDQPLLSANTDLAEKDLDLMAKLGMEYYQVFPGVFEWGPGDPKSAVDRLVRLAHERGMRIGDYSATSQVYSPHFNFYRNKLDHPEWLLRDEDGKPEKIFCFGNPEFVDLYIETVVSNCRRFGFDLHCLDLLKFSPCYATNHRHPSGSDSYYHQIRGLMRILEAIDAVSPQMMTWPNSGDFTEILPKLAWYAPNLYLTDPWIATPWQGLNMTRLLDDARREQMVRLHHSAFLPYRFFTNFQYFLSQNSVVPDIRNFEYGALSTLAVTPNLGLGEIRPWMERLPVSDQDRVTDFYRRWTKLVRDKYSLWTKTCRAGEDPGMGAVEIYSHASGDRGLIFLINPNYWSREVDVPLDATLGFSGQGQCEIAEIYPTECLRLTKQGPWPAFGTQLRMTVPAQQVVVLEVRPASRELNGPRVYGLSGTIEATARGYLFKTSAAQGRSARFAVMLPRGQRPIVSSTVLDQPKEIDPRLSAPTSIELLSSTTEGAVFDITFRRKPAPAELRTWRVQSGTLEEGMTASRQAGMTDGEIIRFPLFADAEVPLPLTDDDSSRLALGPAANFCGAYIDNAFTEMQETWIELIQGDQSALAEKQLTIQEPALLRRPLHELAKRSEKAWWFETSFELPFLYSSGFEPAFDEHTIVVFPLLRQKDVKKITAWINGEELNVQRYSYPVNRKLGCYYADLVGSGAHGGENKLVVHLAF